MKDTRHIPWLAILAAATAATTAFAADPATLPATKPAATRPQSVTISGVIKPAANTTLLKVVAVDRLWADVLKVSKEQPDAAAGDDFIYPATLGKDGGGGAFTIPKLIPGRTYDLIAWTKSADGKVVRWEGVTMDYHRAITPDKPFDAEDKKWIETFITKTPGFYDKCRPLWIAADHKHATVVVELARTADFYSSKSGEVIYRTEIWYFENLFGGWEKDKNTERVLARWRGAGEKLPAWQILPTLGGLTIADDGTFPKIEITLPEKPDPKHGSTGPLTK